ncbi:MAG: hypothetical protein ACYCXH_07505 [Bellilinea sp.]
MAVDLAVICFEVNMRNKPAPNFHDAHSGAAIAVRLKVNAKSTRIRKIDGEGTVFIDIVRGENEQIDLQLQKYLAMQLEVNPSQVEILGSGHSNDRLVMIIGVSADYIEQKIKK